MDYILKKFEASINLADDKDTVEFWLPIMK